MTERLLAWLNRYPLDLGPVTRWLKAGPTTPDEQAALLRALNQLESRFDEIIEAREGPGWLDWDEVRKEWRLLPTPGTPWEALGRQLLETFAQQGYPATHGRRALRLWRDFLFLQDDEVSALQVPAGWVAALDYLLQGLYFSGQATQEEIGQRHNVSTSTVGLRFRALVDTLGLELYDHPARKRLMAQRTILVEGGRMSEAEFNRRLLQGETVLA